MIITIKNTILILNSKYISSPELILLLVEHADLDQKNCSCVIQLLHIKCF